MAIQIKNKMKVGCVCYNVSYNRIISSIRSINPTDVNDFLRFCDIGKRCMGCLPYIDVYIKENRMNVIKFKESIDLVVSANTQIGVKSTTLKVDSGNEFSVEIDNYGEFSDITFSYEKRTFVAYAVPTESYIVIR